MPSAIAKEESFENPDRVVREGEAYTLVSGVEIVEVDDVGDKKHILVVAGAKHFETKGLAAKVLRCINAQPRTIAELRRELFKEDSHVDGSRIQKTLEKLSAFSIVKPLNGSTEEGLPLRRSRWLAPKSYFALRIPLLSRSLVLRVARRIEPLFSPLWTAGLVPALVLSQAAFWSLHRNLTFVLGHLPSGNQLVLLVLGTYAGLLLHEFGHAAACSRFGAQPGSIGFAIYLVFPALYTDVSSSWRLPRSQRMIVDVAGIYMSLLAATLTTALFIATAHPVFAILTWVYDCTVFINLNPFIRMDGYWLLSDALAISNLMTANRETTAWLTRFVFGKTSPRPQVFRLPAMRKGIYVAYYVGFVAFTLFVTWRFYLWYLPYLTSSYPQLMQTTLKIVKGGVISAQSFKAVARLLAATVPLVGPAIYLLRYASKAANHVRALVASYARSRQIKLALAGNGDSENN